MEAYKTFLLAIGGQAVLLAMLGYVGKSLLDKLIIRDNERFMAELRDKTERFKADLRVEADVAIEKLKNDLQIRTIEHQVRFSRLHEKRAQVIAELYGHFVEVLCFAEYFLSPMQWAGEPDQKQKYKAARDKIAECFRYFDKHKIYLPEDLCVSIEGLIMKVREHVIALGVYLPIDYPNEQTRKKQEESWLAGWKAIKGELPVARKKLEDEFRKLLGALAGVVG